MSPRRPRPDRTPRPLKLPPIRFSVRLARGVTIPVRIALQVDPRKFALAAPWLIVAGLLIAGLWWFWPVSRIPAPPPSMSEGYLFTSWNVENLFDDEDDPRNPDTDETWFGQHPEEVREKVRLLAGTLLLQNGGLGPDVLAVVEVENRRAAELLRDALNEGLPPEHQYTGLAQRDVLSGRKFGPAVLTRLPLRDGLTRLYSPRRILEVHLVGSGDAPLTIIAAHWTSRLRDGGEPRRESYADVISQAVANLSDGDRAVDLLVAGDFNDEPGDPAVVDHLHAGADADAAVQSMSAEGPLTLLDLSARIDRDTEGTYSMNGRWEVLDHIVAAPGLLDAAGWRVVPETFRIEKPAEAREGRDGRPWKFGGPNNSKARGPSDHFAVSVRLTVAGP